MYKKCFGLYLSLLLCSCHTPLYNEQQTLPSTPAYNGPIKEIPGIEPRYEPYNQSALQDYQVNGKSYSIVKNPQNFSQVGLVNIENNSGKMTASGEPFDATSFSAAHATLPLPSYVRVTNLSNMRMLVVRINDRGPYNGPIITLSNAAAERLNLTSQTRVKIDFINVAPDGTLSGPGTIGTKVAKQSFALPPRPTLNTTNNSTLESVDNANSNNTPQIAAKKAPSLNNTAVQPGYLLQIGALSNEGRAKAWLQQLSKQFNTPGQLAVNENIYRVQFGPLANHQEALQLQQRVMAQAQLPSFIIIP